MKKYLLIFSAVYGMLFGAAAIVMMIDNLFKPNSIWKTAWPVIIAGVGLLAIVFLAQKYWKLEFTVHDYASLCVWPATLGAIVGFFVLIAIINLS